MQVDEKTLLAIQRWPDDRLYVYSQCPLFSSVRALFVVEASGVSVCRYLAALKILPQYDRHGVLVLFLVRHGLRGAIKVEFRLYSHSRCDQAQSGILGTIRTSVRCRGRYSGRGYAVVEELLRLICSYDAGRSGGVGRKWP
jgi:hypothetical protein